MGISGGYAFNDCSCASMLLNPVSTKANVLINQAGHACITGFHQLSILPDPANIFFSDQERQWDALRWTGPELYDPERFGLGHNCPTIYSDCYALGMVIYETINGRLPFHEYSKFMVVKVI